MKPWVKRLGEVRVQSVNVCQLATGDPKEGQFSSRPVQIHPHSIGAGRDRYSSALAPVHRPVSVFGAVQAPGEVVPTQPAVVTLSFPAHASVGRSY